jgi:hypothetical protein
MEWKQTIAVLEAAAFLGLAATLLACLAAAAFVALAEESPLYPDADAVSRWLFGGWGLTRKILVAALVLAVGYGASLLAVSLASNDRTLRIGEEKYFCELDCHLAYSIEGVRAVKTLGSGPAQIAASGEFYVVSVRTRFDEHTISPHRGDSPLTPGPRLITLVDARGRFYSVASSAQAALANADAPGSVPLDAPLHPGQSYVTRLIFDLPQDAASPRLLIRSPAQPGWLGHFLIGDEESLFHRKVFLALG